MTCSWVSCKHKLGNFSSDLLASFMLISRSCAKRCKLLLAKASLLALLLMAASFFLCHSKLHQGHLGLRLGESSSPAGTRGCRDALGAASASFGYLLPPQFSSVLEDL